MRTELTTKPIPAWLADMEFCHVAVDDDGLYSYCGGSDGEGSPPTCNSFWDGQAICSGCGLPMCPRCAQLCSLEDELDA